MKTQPHLNEMQALVGPIIERALSEDIGAGDVTTEAIVPPEMWLTGRFIAKEGGVVAGLEVVRWTFGRLDERVELAGLVADGDPVEAGQVVATVRGPGRVLLGGERVALNFLQRMSGIATLTRRLAEATAGTPAVILDTRKTAPGLRPLDKWAVRLGGGQNHRSGLYDMVLIKENHIAAAGGIARAVERVRANETRPLAVEVEVKNLAELQEALALNVDRIMLDNMSLEEMARAVQLAGGRTPLEASGNVSVETIAAIARTGVDYISAGMLTHSVRAMDISLLLEQAGQET